MNLGSAKKWCVKILESPIQGFCLKDETGVYSVVGLLEELTGEIYTYDNYMQCYANSEKKHLTASSRTLKSVKAKTDLSRIDDKLRIFCMKRIF